MLHRLVMFAIAGAFIWPGAVVAQEEMSEETSPPMLMISSWKCDFGSVGAIDEDWEAGGMASAQTAIADGHWVSAGVFYHDWSDEWNVHFWAVGEDEAHLIDGQYASNDAYEAAAGEDGLDLWEHCSEHKDGFYQLAQSADTGEAAGDGPGPAMAMSSWKCTDVGAVWAEWENYTLAKAQAVVDAGQWNDAGMFTHAWAGEWNVTYYYMGDDIPAILEGWDTFIASMDDGAMDITSVCSEHKDGFYTFGGTAVAADEAAAGD